MKNWTKCSDILPHEGDWVLVHLNDYEPFEFCVAKIRIGISKLEREKMKRGEIPDMDVGLLNMDGYHTAKRSVLTYDSDEANNNSTPYNWEISCGQNLFGHHVDYWMPIPEFNL